MYSCWGRVLLFLLSPTGKWRAKTLLILKYMVFVSTKIEFKRWLWRRRRRRRLSAAYCRYGGKTILFLPYIVSFLPFLFFLSFFRNRFPMFSTWILILYHKPDKYIQSEITRSRYCAESRPSHLIPERTHC